MSENVQLHPSIDIKNVDEHSDMLSQSAQSTANDSTALVQFELDMTQLKDYLNTITKVVNQHAKLLDDVSKELAVRPQKNEIGEVFDLLSRAFPYERMMSQMKWDNHPPRNAEIIRQLSVHKVSTNLALDFQHTRPVEDMWEGADRFLKTMEVGGIYCQELKAFQHHEQERNERIDEAIAGKVESVEFKHELKKLKEKMELMMEEKVFSINDRFEKRQSHVDDYCDNLMKKIEEVEVNTYWKIKDYEELLKQRPTKISVDDTVKDKFEQCTKEYKSFTDAQISLYGESVDYKFEKAKYEQELLNKNLTEFKDYLDQEQREQTDKLKDYTNVSDNFLKEQMRQEIRDLGLELEETLGRGKRTISANKRSPDNSIVARGKSSSSLVKGAASVKESTISPSPSPVRSAMQEKDKTVEQLCDDDMDLDDEQMQAVQAMIANIKNDFERRITHLENDHANSDSQLRMLQTKVQGKAGKDAVVKGQKNFMKDLKDQEGQIDGQIKKYIQDEFMKIGSKFAEGQFKTDRRIELVEKQCELFSRNMDQAIDDKLERVKQGFNAFASQQDMMRVEAKIELLQQDYERLNAFMENIMNLVRTLEEKVNNGPTTMYKASLRGKQIMPEMCLSCGQTEVAQMATGGLSGVYYRDGKKTHSRETSPINPNRIEVFTSGTLNGISSSQKMAGGLDSSTLTRKADFNSTVQNSAKNRSARPMSSYNARNNRQQMAATDGQIMFRPKQGGAPIDKIAVRQQNMALAVNLLQSKDSKANFHPGVHLATNPTQEFERVFKRA